MRQFENLKIVVSFMVVTVLLFGCSKKEKIQMRMPTSRKVEKYDPDFDVFFRKFAGDSVFQKEHVVFPLKNSYSDEDYIPDDMIESDIMDVESYQFVDYSKDKEASKLEHWPFKPVIRTFEDTIYYTRFGVNNDFHIDYKFVCKNGEWFLVEVIDLTG
jgi:hypothetical protein